MDKKAQKKKNREKVAKSKVLKRRQRIRLAKKSEDKVDAMWKKINNEKGAEEYSEEILLNNIKKLEEMELEQKEIEINRQKKLEEENDGRREEI